MSDEIFVNGVRFISTATAAHQTGLSRDYIYRLCKEGRLTNRKVGSGWYVSQDAVKVFIEEQEETRLRRKE